MGADLEKAERMQRALLNLAVEMLPDPTREEYLHVVTEMRVLMTNASKYAGDLALCTVMNEWSAKRREEGASMVSPVDALLNQIFRGPPK